MAQHIKFSNVLAERVADRLVKAVRDWYPDDGDVHHWTWYMHLNSVLDIAEAVSEGRGRKMCLVGNEHEQNNTRRLVTRLLFTNTARAAQLDDETIKNLLRRDSYGHS